MLRIVSDFTRSHRSPTPGVGDVAVLLDKARSVRTSPALLELDFLATETPPQRAVLLHIDSLLGLRAGLPVT